MVFSDSLPDKTFSGFIVYGLQKSVRLNIIGCFSFAINVIGHLSRYIPLFLYIFDY